MVDRTNPYEPPSTDGAGALETELIVAPQRYSAGRLLGASLAVYAAAVALAWVTESSRVATVGCGLATLLAVVGTFRGVVRAAGLWKAGAAASKVSLATLAVGGGLAMSALGAFSTFLSTLTFSRGRQLRRLGRVLLPPTREGSEWTTVPTELDVAADPALRAALAAQWRENGKTEHASVAAFARLTLNLVALGAPPALIASAQRDALDEIRHAELCFSLARALDGRAESPAAFPEAAHAGALVGPRSLALAQLAVSSLIDGALHEGVSARIVARLAKRSDVPAIRAVLKVIAADEGRHARHGIDVVAWCVAEGGAPVVHALVGAARALPRVFRTPLPEGAGHGAWEPFGIHGHALEAEEYAAARADVVRRVEAMSESARAARAAA